MDCMSPSLRYAYAHRGLNGVRQNLAIGLGIENVLSQNDDLIGVAGSWQEPSRGGSSSDQYVIETFYRFYLTPQTHILTRYSGRDRPGERAGEERRHQSSGCDFEPSTNGPKRTRIGHISARRSK